MVGSLYFLSGVFKGRLCGGYDMGDPFQTQMPDTQLFRDVFNASPIGIAVENLNGQPLFVNPALCAMLGFSEEEMGNKHCVDFSPPEDAAKDWELFQQLRAGAIDHYQLEKQYFRRDGSLVWGSLSVSLLNGRPSPLVIAMVEDITAKKKAEEAQLRHAAIVESSEDAIMSVTLDGIITSWNTGAQRIYGYTEAEALGKPINLVVPPELPDEEDKILETLRTGKRIEHFETVRVTKTGKKINVSLSVSPIKGPTGETVGCAGIARDITERKRHEVALRTSEERLREYERAVEASGEMITVIDREYRCLMANREYLNRRNLSRHQVVGHFAYEFVDQRIFEQVIKPKLDECFTGKVVNYELKYTYPELGERDLSISYFPIEGPGGVDRVACLLQDVTDRKKAEQTLAEMTRKLIEAQEQERARISRELHDDIGQRLAMLVFELEALQENPPERQNRVQELRKRVIEISDDVQTLSHELHSSKLKYLGVVAGIRGWCKEFSERHRIEIDFSTDVSNPMPVEIGLPLFRVVQEAVHNAAKHGEVNRVDVQLKREGDAIRLIVSDLGKGFDLEAATQGKGLGLTSMRERVRLVNGSILIRSAPLAGTTIDVRVPLVLNPGLHKLAV
jgi:PAS domain S-box-containing protein